MKQFFLILQIVLSVFMIGLIILQNKDEGMGRTVGTQLASFSTRRGIEKFLYAATIIITALFLISSLVNFSLK